MPNPGPSSTYHHDERASQSPLAGTGVRASDLRAGWDAPVVPFACQHAYEYPTSLNAETPFT